MKRPLYGILIFFFFFLYLYPSLNFTFNDNELEGFIYPFHFKTQPNLLQYLLIDSYIGDQVIRPLPSIVWYFAYCLFGLRVGYYHLLLLFFYLLVGVAVYLFVHRIFSDRVMAFLVAWFVVLHPTNRYLLISPTFYVDTLAALFFLLAAYFHIFYYLEARKFYGLLLAIFLWLLSVASKESGVPMFLVPIAYGLIYRSGRIRERIGRFLSYLPYILIIIFYFLLRIGLIGQIGKFHDPWDRLVDPVKITENLCWIFGVHPQRFPGYIFWLFFLLPFIPGINLHIRFGAAFLLINFAPILNISAERYALLPSVGLGIALIALLGLLTEKLGSLFASIEKRAIIRKIALFLAAALLILAFSNSTVIKNYLREINRLKNRQQLMHSLLKRYYPVLKPQTIFVIYTDQKFMSKHSAEVKLADTLSRGFEYQLRLLYDDPKLQVLVNPKEAEIEPLRKNHPLIYVLLQANDVKTWVSFGQPTQLMDLKKSQ